MSELDDIKARAEQRRRFIPASKMYTKKLAEEGERDLDRAIAIAEGARDMADLILRQHFALVEEGIGPRPAKGNDKELLRRIVLIAGCLYDRHALWDSHLLTDEEHQLDGCQQWPCGKTRKTDG